MKHLAARRIAARTWLLKKIAFLTIRAAAAKSQNFPAPLFRKTIEYQVVGFIKQVL